MNQNEIANKAKKRTMELGSELSKLAKQSGMSYLHFKHAVLMGVGTGFYHIVLGANISEFGREPTEDEMIDLMNETILEIHNQIKHDRKQKEGEKK